MAAGELPHSFSIKASEFKKLIDKTQFAISTEETRYYLNGIYFHAFETDGAIKLRAVATDGHRLARADIPAPKGAEGMPGIIVPRKTVGEIQRLIEDPKAELKVELSDAKIRLTVGNVVLTASDFEVLRRRNPELLDHEDAHAWQWFYCAGLPFLPLYGLACAWSWLRRGDVWSGNFYALAVTERLGIEERGGVVRAGLAHYNTREEVDYCLACLREIA